MNKERLRQVTIQAWKDDVHNFMECANLKIADFTCQKIGKFIHCVLTFKDSPNRFALNIDPSVSYWNEVIN